MPKHHFSALETSAHNAATHWPSRRSHTARSDQEHTRYFNASELLVADVERGIPLYGKEATRHPAAFGMQIMIRVCYTAAVLARQKDITSADELGSTLRSDETFETLRTLLTTPNPTVLFTEERLGLTSIEEPIGEDELKHWEINSSSLSVPDIHSLIASTRRSFNSDKEVECPAHRAKIIRPLFESAITVCERDDHLFKRSLIADDIAHGRTS